jgi:hypothetical protein
MKYCIIWFTDTTILTGNFEHMLCAALKITNIKHFHIMMFRCVCDISIFILIRKGKSLNCCSNYTKYKTSQIMVLQQIY